jgi:hypothetical protein
MHVQTYLEPVTQTHIYRCTDKHTLICPWMQTYMDTHHADTYTDTEAHTYGHRYTHAFTHKQIDQRQTQAIEHTDIKTWRDGHRHIQTYTQMHTWKDAYMIIGTDKWTHTDGDRRALRQKLTHK